MDTQQQLDNLLRERILIIDGAMGTMVQRHISCKKRIIAGRNSRRITKDVQEQ